MEASTKSPQKFAIRAPSATSVQLAGDFTHWQSRAISLRKGAGGVWSTMVDLAPGTYHYRFLVDGDWQDDPECTLRVANAFGTQNAVRTV